MLTIDALQEIKERVARGWCRGALAQNADGFSVGPKSVSAVQWCLVGAIEACNDPGGVVIALRGLITGSSLTYWNDYVARDQQDVLDLLDRAIRKEELRETRGAVKNA